MELKGSKTARNLATAFAGESQARNRYTYMASVARKEGFIQISAIFEETANQEKEHAKRLFKFMTGGEQAITETFPFGVIGSTLDNLRAAAAGEKHEVEVMYPTMAAEAEAEGFREIAMVMRQLVTAESHHGKRYTALADNIERGQVFRRDDPATAWRCINCGWLFTGAEAPHKCPACAHAQGYFELLCENW